MAVCSAARITSSYFGDRGRFAFDENGDCLVLQGYGWIWKSPLLSESTGRGGGKRSEVRGVPSPLGVLVCSE